MYGLTVQTAAAADPVTLTEVKANCNVAHDAKDAWFRSEIAAAISFVQDETSRQLINATFDLQLDYWPCGVEPILIPRAPLSSITSITYLESSAGVSTAWSSSNYRVITSTTPGKVHLAYGASYPALYPVAGPVTVRFVAGYGATASSVPEELKSAIKLFVLARFEGRPIDEDRSLWALITKNRVPDEWLRYEREPYQSGSY